MRSTDLNGAGVGEYLRRLSALAFDVGWAVRLVDESGTTYQIPNDAIASRSRASALDGGTWELTLEIYENLLPAGVSPKQYHQIQIDRICAGQWAYFRGILDEVPKRVTLEGSAAVTVLRLHGFGMLQKCKGHRIDALRYPVSGTGGIYASVYHLLGICSTQIIRVDTVVGAGGSETLPQGAVTLDLSTTLVISPNSNLSSPYTAGVDYTLNTATTPATINWINNPAEPRYFKFYRVDRWVAPVREVAPASYNFVVLPQGRDYQDLYHTTIAAIDAGAKTITPTDPTGYRDKLDTASLSEFLFITHNGSFTYGQISSVSASGVLTMTAIPVGIAVGDPIWLGTTDFWAAWDDDVYVRFYTDSTAATEYNLRTFQPAQNIGQVFPTSAKTNWLSTDAVWASISTIQDTTSGGVYVNRVEEAIKYLLTTTTGLFTAGTVTVTQTGALMKNYARYATTLDEVLKELKEHSLLPNAYLHDHPDGTITVKPYSQSDTASWTLHGVVSVDEEELPEPITAVTVISADAQTVNLAPQFFDSTSGITNPQYIIDGAKVDAATPSVAGTTVSVTFKVPAANPIQTFPAIDKIVFSGRGMVTVFMLSGTVCVSGFVNRQVNTGESLEIPGDLIAQLMCQGPPTSTVDIKIQVAPIIVGGTTTDAAINEIEILTRTAAAFRAELTDDTAKTTAPADTTQFGDVWKQPDPNQRVSYRYAPSSYLKRVATLYGGSIASVQVTNPGSGYTSAPTVTPSSGAATFTATVLNGKVTAISVTSGGSYTTAPTLSFSGGGGSGAAATPTIIRHRQEVRRFDGISQQDARDYAERYLDEYVRTGKHYTVVAPLVDFAELGDTVNVPFPDGTVKTLFLWSMSDSGQATNALCTYRFIDYSL